MFLPLRRRRLPIVAALTAVLMFQSFGWMAAWWAVRQEARRGAERVVGHPAERLKRLALETAEFRKARIDAHEILVDGRLYDFRILQISGDSVFLAIYHDQKEERLLKSLGILSAPHNAPVQPVGAGIHFVYNQWLKCLATPFLVPAATELYGVVRRRPPAFYFYPSAPKPADLVRLKPPPEV